MLLNLCNTILKIEREKCICVLEMTGCRKTHSALILGYDIGTSITGATLCLLCVGSWHQFRTPHLCMMHTALHSLLPLACAFHVTWIKCNRTENVKRHRAIGVCCLRCGLRATEQDFTCHLLFWCDGGGGWRIPMPTPCVLGTYVTVIHLFALEDVQQYENGVRLRKWNSKTWSGYWLLIVSS